MPIKPENKKLYPKNWSEIRAEIQKRAGDKCEGCGVANYAEGVRDKDGTFHAIGTAGAAYLYDTVKDLKFIRIVCTVAHLDHKPQNNGVFGDRPNLKFYCQRCHNNHDKEHRAKNRAKTRLVAKSKQLSLLDTENK